MPFFLIFFIKAYVVGTHLNCIDICLYKEVDKKYTCCNLKTTETLRKHAYSNILKISPRKNENFQIKKSEIFHISAQNIDCGYSLELPRRDGSNEYHNLCF